MRSHVPVFLPVEDHLGATGDPQFRRIEIDVSRVSEEGNSRLAACTRVNQSMIISTASTVVMLGSLPGGMSGSVTDPVEPRCLSQGLCGPGSDLGEGDAWLTVPRVLLCQDDRVAKGDLPEISPEQASKSGGQVRDEDLPMLAAVWLAQGYDSDELQELAGMTRHEAREGRRRLLAGVLSSLGWPMRTGTTLRRRSRGWVTGTGSNGSRSRWTGCLAPARQ
jgi:hypothetical protein